MHEKNIICKIPDFIENIEERMQFLDQNLYLQDDILTKVDRASMASSLEVRVPLLDHRLVQASWRLPLKYKLSQGKTKFIFKRNFKEICSRKLVFTAKNGIWYTVKQLA